jgi:hypothetical protein
MADLSTRRGYTGATEGFLQPDWTMDRGVVARRQELRDLSALSRSLRPIQPLVIEHGMDDRESSNAVIRPRGKGSYSEEWAPLIRHLENIELRETGPGRFATRKLFPSLVDMYPGPPPSRIAGDHWFEASPPTPSLADMLKNPTE